ncbi:MAG: hypothetical protein U0457_00235 [Candidatus Sericytochromatia bacterium]
MENETEIDFDLDDFSNYVTLNTKKTCIGKKNYAYNLSLNIELDFFNLFENNYILSYPLGEKYKYFSADFTGKYTLTGILGTNEIKMILKFSASINEKKEFEKLLIKYCQK